MKPPKQKNAAPKKKTPSKSPRGKSAARPKKGTGKGTGPRKKPIKRPPPAPSKGPLKDNPEAKALAKKIAQAVLDKKASDVVILDVRGMTSYADYVVVASGESDRQVMAMAENVIGVLRDGGRRPIGHEGTETGQWVLIDYGEVVAHLFYSEVRSFYDLEGLWAEAPKEKVA